jgi:hypothetical protein
LLFDPQHHPIGVLCVTLMSDLVVSDGLENYL